MNAKEIMAALLAVVLLIGIGVGGTLAWLTATSGTVTNTFTVGDVNIELKEHKLNDTGTALLTGTDNEVNAEDSYKIVPGDTQPKDPFVRVKANSEDSWIFVQIKEVNNNASTDLKYVEWLIDNSLWTHLNTNGNIHTYVLTNNYTTKTADETYDVLLSDTVTYNSELTKANLEALDKDAVDTTGYGTIEDDEMPQLIFKAFAVQAEAATDAADAWSQIASTAKLS